MSAAPVLVRDLEKPAPLALQAGDGSRKASAQEREKRVALLWASVVISGGIVVCFLLMQWMCCSA